MDQYADVWIGIVYSACAFLGKFYLPPESISFLEGIEYYYSVVVLPFNGIVLFSVLFDVAMDFWVSLFYISRYIDYIQTLQLIRKQSFHSYNLHVFHHATVPSFIRLSWDDKYLTRFVVFLVGTSAALYATSDSDSRSKLFSSDYLSELTPVQWTQYAIVVVHTIRTTSRTRRFWLGLYTCVFVIVTYQYFEGFN